MRSAVLYHEEVICGQGAGSFPPLFRFFPLLFSVRALGQKYSREDYEGFSPPFPPFFFFSPPFSFYSTAGRDGTTQTREPPPFFSFFPLQNDQDNLVIIKEEGILSFFSPSIFPLPPLLPDE